MTQTAYEILRLKASEKEARYVCDEKYADFVFLCRKGSPIKNSTYDTALYKLTERQTLAITQIIPWYRHTQGQEKRRLLTPDEVLRLPSNELLCIIRGCNMLKLEKLDYVKRPMSKQIRKASVMDYHPVQEVYFAPQIESERKEANQEPAKPKKTLYNLARAPEDF